ncbi:Prolyl oligopeptidase family protein [Halobacillus alkaliphilus]|uniref:Prolyl oligopeptidase family protein n=1 Tax=Halobacillus alkaliphilus TaxID=396056 RepID=A0A1I2JWL7_9BACI|nr:prolyl oligopeptidase family serine peptidase [Halobacillus alkaliphilus]SFF57211.1 Prolyl oligopeptidase family protein [Halobacillus alkaliphilus]
MKKLLFIVIILLLVGCETDNHDIILSNEIIEVPETKHSRTTETYKITYRSDGLEVTGFMVRPKEIEKDLPLLIFNRGGNQEYGEIDEKLLATYLSLWAKKGYVVLASQYRGNDGGEGKEEFGGADVNDVLNLVQAAEELPNVDVENKVMLGLSRGGMMTYLAIKEGVDIKAAAVVGGITDLFNFYKERVVVRGMLDELVGDPEENRDAFKKRSAVYWPDQLDVPLLIMHGEDDWRVPVGQARELSSKLSRENAHYEYVEYEDGQHLLNSYVEEYTDKTDQWFQHHINE